MNFVYPAAKQAFLDGAISLTAHAIRCALIDTSYYTVSTAHTAISDVPSGAIVATSGTLTNVFTTNGVADANDVTFSAVNGATCEAVIIYKDTGQALHSTLICYIDTATGLPATPIGTDVTVQFDNGQYRIFAI
jgi:hypothetical protein